MWWWISELVWSGWEKCKKKKRKKICLLFYPLVRTGNHCVVFGWGDEPPAQILVAWFPRGCAHTGHKPVRAGSLRPRGTCYSFSSISSASLWLLVFILPHYSFSLSFIFYLSCLWVPLLLSKRLCLEITFWNAACSLTLGHPRSLFAFVWKFPFWY